MFDDSKSILPCIQTSLNKKQSTDFKGEEIEEELPEADEERDKLLKLYNEGSECI